MFEIKTKYIDTTEEEFLNIEKKLIEDGWKEQILLEDWREMGYDDISYVDKLQSEMT